MGFTVQFMLGIFLLLFLCKQIESGYLKRQPRELKDSSSNKEVIIKNQTKPSYENVQINNTIQTEKIEKPFKSDILTKLIPQEIKPKTDTEKKTNLDSIIVDNKNQILPEKDEASKKNTTTVKLEKSEPYLKKVDDTNNPEKLYPNIKVAETVQKNEVRIDQSKQSKDVLKDKNIEDLRKSLDIEKYVSKEFHNINNVYTLPTSPDTEKFLNYDFEHQSSTYHEPDFTKSFGYSTELTTPKSSFFDSKYKEAVESFEEKFEHIDNAFSESNDSSETPEINVDHLHDQTKNNDTNAQLNFLHYNKIIGNDAKNKSNYHKDLEVEEIKNVDFRSSYNETKLIDEKPAVDDANGNNQIAKEINPDTVHNENINQVVKVEQELSKTETTTIKSFIIHVENSSNETGNENPIKNYNTTAIPESIQYKSIDHGLKAENELKKIETTTAINSQIVAKTENTNKQKETTVIISESVRNEQIHQRIEPETAKPETTTPKNIYLFVTTRKNLITKPTPNKNSSHHSILSNKIETETIKATNSIKLNPVTLPVSTTTTETSKTTKSPAITSTKKYTRPVDITKRGSVKFADYTKPMTTTQATTIRYRNRNKTVEQNKLNKTTEQLFQENQIIPVHVKAPEEVTATTTSSTIKFTLPPHLTSESYVIDPNVTKLVEKLATLPESTTVPMEISTLAMTTDYTFPTETLATTDEIISTTTDSALTTSSNKFTTIIPENVETDNPTTAANLETTTNTEETTTVVVSEEATTTIQSLLNLTSSIETIENVNNITTNVDTTTEQMSSTTLDSLKEIENSTIFPKLNQNKTEFEITTMKTSKPVTENNIRTSKGFIFENSSTFSGVSITPLPFMNTTISIPTSSKTLQDTSTALPMKLETTTSNIITSTASVLSNEVIKLNTTSTSSTTSTTKSSIDDITEEYEDPDDTDEEEIRKDQIPLTTTTELVFVNIGSNVNHTVQPDIYKPVETNPEMDGKKFVDNKISTSVFDENVMQPTTDPNELVNPEDNSGTIAAIVISSVGAVCLIALAGLLFIMKKRQKRFNYGQRCTPVSLDDYSMDNVSVYNSVRRKGVLRTSKRSYGNPAFEDPASVSHPLNFPALVKFANNFEDIKAEFDEIPQISARTNELPEGCDTKNRYANVIPLPETRVPLNPIDNYPNSDYINANYVTGPRNVKGYYIACQAPMQNTVDDFWRMVWEQQTKVVLMLTHLYENGIEKSVDYLPPSEVIDCHRLFGDFQITLKKREVKDKYIISILQLKNMVSNCWREVTHLWYLGWPDKGVPLEANSLIAFLIEARSYMKTSLDKKDVMACDISNGSTKPDMSPVVVHCSPGTGRTGVVIACDIAIREFEQNRLVDIPRIVYRIRRDRASSVQTKDQYTFIYKVISLYATKLTGGALDSF